MQVTSDAARAEFRKRPGHLVNRASRLMLRHGEVQLQPLGLGVAAFPVLMLLRGGVEMTQKQLTACTHLEQPSMAQLLGRLERDGMIARKPDARDGRSSLIRLTDAAEALLPQVDQIARAANAQALSGFSAAEADQFTSYLLRIIANLEAGAQVPKD